MLLRGDRIMCSLVPLFLRVALLLSGARAIAMGVDRTVEPEAAGLHVVVASIDRLRQLNLFPNDNQFLRRIAYVESRDGVDITTYRDGYHGGIWQVDEEVFLLTQNVAAAPELELLLQGVVEGTGIDWLAVVWSDLRKPLYSALATSIYFTLVPGEIPGAGDLQGQASYWKNYFSSDPQETVNDFIRAVEELESEECPVRGLDLVFAFDSSGSVGSVNFTKEKDFAANVSSIFNIGLGATHVGAVSFSGVTYFVLPLNTFISGQSLRQGLRAIEYNAFPGRGPNTNTSGALRTIREQLFTEEGGARPPELAFPRVVVVITDGRSNVDHELTLPAAKALHDDGVMVFAVGIGKDIQVEELQGIASDPSFVSMISGFNVVELRGVQSTLSEEACRVPAPLRVEQQIQVTAQMAKVTYFQYQLPEEGMTVRLKVESGRAVLYASHRIRNPSSAFYDFRLKTGSTADVFVDPVDLEGGVGDARAEVAGRRKRRQEEGSRGLTNTTLYVSIEGLQDDSRFVLETTYGDTSTSSGTTCTAHSITSCVVMILALLLSEQLS